MTLTLLLDLDGTLLRTNLPEFIPAYFRALSGFLSDRVLPEVLLPALISGTRLMAENMNPMRSLQDVFEAEFYPRIGISKDALLGQVDTFYEDVFPGLGALTAQMEGVGPFVDWALAHGCRLAIATDPLLPRPAVLERLRWAGLDHTLFEIIPSYEDFHFSKSQPEYFAELLGRMGWPEGDIIMVGNDLERDIIPARRLGIQAYHVNAAAPAPDAHEPIHGTLRDIMSWIDSAEPGGFAPQIKTTEATVAVLRAAPAALLGMAAKLKEGDWRHESAPGDWSLVEIVCHLRDTEREVHHAQIRLFEKDTEPFVPRPEASVWARQRPYRMESDLDALREFAVARIETMEMLARLSAHDWLRPAKHAIFGPTHFLEVVGFMAEHDRLHLQQAWKTLRSR